MRFLLVDRITALDEVTIAGEKHAAMSEDYFEWHFPDHPVVPGTLILEAFVQLAGWLEAKTSDFDRWVLLDRVGSARYDHPAVPGDTLRLHLERVSSDGDRRVYRGESRIGDRRAARLEFEGVAVGLADLEDPARVRRAFQGLYRPTAGTAGGGR
jgi:3-hydroxymyristoyl/3-hydroxydecanoyl-(acyl carrier protein) dehydratase